MIAEIVIGHIVLWQTLSMLAPKIEHIGEHVDLPAIKKKALSASTWKSSSKRIISSWRYKTYRLKIWTK